MTVTPRADYTPPCNRDAWLEINLANVEHNYHVISQTVSPLTSIMAVIKADAYGHGALTIANVLQGCGCTNFGVANIDEGLQLRNNGIQSEILILSPVALWAIPQAINANLQISISSWEHIKTIESLNLTTPTNIQVCINTGMNREGIHHSDASNLISYILSHPNIFNLKGVFSHLAFHPQETFSQTQLSHFQSTIKNFSREKLGLVHIGASASIPCPEFHFDLVRPGIALHGLGESISNLRPVLSLKCRLSHIQTLPSNEGVGYQHTWKTASAQTIGLLPLGYADGVKRSLSNKIYVYYRKQKIPQVGLISMDQMSVDISSIEKPQIGDIITILGESLPLTNWTNLLGTIDYEVACDLRARLPKIYTRN